VTANPDPETRPKRLVSHSHKRRPLRSMVVPLLVILAVILFLPYLLELLD
jgi:hypothetical protein